MTFHLSLIERDESLLIGGSWDGTRLQIPKSLYVLEMWSREENELRPILLSSAGLYLEGPKREVYEPQPWAVGDERFSLWVVKEMTCLEAFVCLLSGYNPVMLLDELSRKD